MTRLRRLSVAALLGSALSCASTTARAEPYRLQWLREPGAESCVSGAALTRLLEQVIGPAASAQDMPVLVEGRIAPAAPPLRWRMTLRVSDVHGELLGERELTHAAPHCSALTSSLLLILAMSIDPDAARSGLPPSVVEELRRDRAEDVDVWPAAHVPELDPRGSAPASFQDAPTPPALSPPRAQPARHSVWQLLFGFALATGILPEVSPGLTLGGRLALAPAWSLSLSVDAWVPRNVAMTGPYSMADGVEFGALQSDFRLCRSLLGTDDNHLGACVGGALGARWVSANALETRANPWRAYFGPELGVEGKLALGSRCFVSGGVSALAPLPQVHYTYVDHRSEERTLFAPNAIAGWAFLNLGTEL